MNNQKPWRFFPFREGGNSCWGSNARVEVSKIESQELQPLVEVLEQENVGFFLILISSHSHTIRHKAKIPKYLIWIQSSNVSTSIIIELYSKKEGKPIKRTNTQKQTNNNISIKLSKSGRQIQTSCCWRCEAKWTQLLVMLMQPKQ